MYSNSPIGFGAANYSMMSPIFPTGSPNSRGVMAMEAPTVAPAYSTPAPVAEPVVAEIPPAPAPTSTMMIVSSLAAVAILGFGFYYFSTKR